MRKLRGFKTALFVLLIGITVFAGVSCAPEKTEKTVKITQISNPETMLTKFRNREIDGFLLWEPYPQEAVIGKYGKMLKTSAEIWPNHPDCIVAVSNERVDETVLQAFMWAHIKSTRFINDPANREQVIKYTMEFAQKNRPVIEASLNNIKFEEYPDETEFKNYYNELTKSPILTRKVKDLGYETDGDFFADFLDRKTYDFVRTRLEQDPEWRPAPVTSDGVVRFARIVPGIFNVASYIAEKEGIYEEVGLIPGKNLEIQEYFHGIAIMQKFKTNELDIAYVGVAPATLKRINDDIDIRVVAGVEGQDSGLVVRDDLDINDVSDLAGKTLAIPAVGNVQYVLLEKAVREAGLKPVIQ